MRSKIKDGFSNRVETFLLTHFRLGWKLVEKLSPLRGWVNRFLIRRAILKTKSRPHQFSLKSDYTSWDSLTDREFTGRHLPPASDEFAGSLPPLEEVVELFRRRPDTYRMSQKSTVLFTNFAQWFTDGFLRTERLDPNKPGSEETYYRRNTSNHEIDLCQVYGLRREQTDQLRTKIGGQLKTSVSESGAHFPPLYFDAEMNPKPEFDEVIPQFLARFPEERKRHLFVGGVERLNVQIGYSMLNTLFLREHNRIAKDLAEKNGWDEVNDDEQIFQTARNVLVVVLLRIVIEDYINHITPYHFKFSVTTFSREKWYRTNWMTIEFNLLYRWHSMIPNSVLVGGDFVPLVDSLFNNKLLVDNGMAACFREASKQRTAELGLMNTPAGPLLETELKSLELGRKAKLQSYNDYRELFSYPRVTHWNQITGNKEFQAALEKTYKHVDNIELFVGLFAEDVRESSALSPLIGRMVGVDAFSQALTNPLLSKNVFNEQTFTAEGMKIIQETGTLRDLLNRNLQAGDEPFDINFTQDGDELDEPPMGSAPDDGPSRGHEGSRDTGPPSEASLEGAGASFDEKDLYLKK